MKYTTIKYQRKKEVAWITLNRPDKLNALNQVLMSEWRHLLSEIAQDDTCRIVVVKGEGRAWSAGVDLSVFETTKIQAGNQMYYDGQAVMHFLETMPQVTIAMLNGYCYTGALEIMMAFDLIITADEAKIGDTHTKWGIPPTWGMTQRLQKQVGLRKAKELSFTAEAISGTEAARIGLVNQAVPLQQLQNTIDTLIDKILKNNAQTIAAMKKLYHYGSQHTLKEGFEYEKNFKANLTNAAKLKNFKKEI